MESEMMLVERLRAAFDGDNVPHKNIALRKAAALIESQSAEIARLKARLEIDPEWDSEDADGISCRNDTIAILDKNVATLTARYEALEHDKMTRKPDELIQLKLRFREDLRARAETSAEQNGNSLNAEIVSRLRQSFEIEEEFGGSTGLRMFRSMAVALFMTEQRQGDWRTDRYAFEAAKAAIARVMDEFAPGYPDDVVEIAQLDEKATNLKAQIDELKVDLEARRPRKPLPPGTGMFGRMLGGLNEMYDGTMGEVALDVELATEMVDGEDADLFRKYHAMRREYDPLDPKVAALVALAEHGIPTDVQELLVSGDPHCGIRPGAIDALLAALGKVSRADIYEECARIVDHVADGLQFVGDTEEGRIRHDGIASGVRFAATAIRSQAGGRG